MEHSINKTKILVISIQLVLVAFFLLGAQLENTKLKILYYSYYADLAIPFGFYFLLKLLEKNNQKIKHWYVKGLSVFLLCSLSETLQYFGIFALARTFDPIDYLAYGIGIILAILIDRQIIKRSFSFWK